MAEKKVTKKADKVNDEVTIESVAEQLKAKRQDHLEAKRSLASGELANPLVIRQIRRDIARLETKLTALRKEAVNG